MIAAIALACYTNLAGKVISATPVGVEGTTVVFDCGAVGVRALPLGIFPPGEQARIRLATGIREMPAELKGLAVEIEGQRKRYESRAAAGRLSKEKLAENLEMLSGSWRHAVEELELPLEEKSYWKGKCP